MDSPEQVNQESHDSLAIGDVFEERYKIVAQIAGGGMAHVYHGVDMMLQREIVLKILKQSAEASSSARERFLRETKALAALDHQNIVRFYNSGITESNTMYVVMEFVPGESLQSLLAREGYLKSDQFMLLFKQILTALRFVHEKNVVHRDIKPSNLMIHDSNVKLIDFGIARILGQESDGKTLTQTSVMVGTPLYMSPEQCRGARGERLSDIYSLACVMYECIKAEPPFSGGSPYEVMFKHMSVSAPKMIPQAKSEKGKLLASMIDKCLSKNISERCQNVDEMMQLIDQSDGVDLSEFRNSMATKNLTPLLACVGIGILLVVGATLTFRSPGSKTSEIVIVDREKNELQKLIKSTKKDIEVLEASKDQKLVDKLLRAYIKLCRAQAASNNKSDVEAAIRTGDKAISVARNYSNLSIGLPTCYFLRGEAEMKAREFNNSYKSFLSAYNMVSKTKGEQSEERFELCLMLANLDFQIGRVEQAASRLQDAFKIPVQLDGYLTKESKMDAAGMDKLKMLFACFDEMLKCKCKTEPQRAAALDACFTIAMQLHDLKENTRFKQATDFYQKTLAEMETPSADMKANGEHLKLMQAAKDVRKQSFRLQNSTVG